MNQPHFVRFAQALALVTGLAGCAASTTQASDSGGGGSDSGGGGSDAAVVADGGTDGGAGDAATGIDAATAEDAAQSSDTGVLADAALDCFTCNSCPGSEALPPCPTGLLCACAIPGPLVPPDLAV